MERTVKIGSSVEGTFDPDQLTVTVTIEENLDTKEECSKAYNTNLAAVRDGLAKAGVPDSDISTRRFTLRPHTERLYYKKSKNDYYYAKTVIEGYEYSGEVVVTTSQLDKAALIWLALTDCGSAVTFDMDFGIADETPSRNSLLEYAVQEAKKNAEILTKASGANLGPIASIEHDFSKGGRDYDGNLYAPDFLGAPDEQAPEFTPEPVHISCRVKCIWTLQ